MADPELQASLARTERHLREAVHHQPLPEETRAMVLHFIDHNELGVAFEHMTSALLKAGAVLEPEARDALAAAAEETRLEDNADWLALSR